MLSLLASLPPSLLAAQRAPVLQQIDVPHNYYYREMYLPQVTSGPSSAAWSPDGTELVYSMQGSLWRQRLGTTDATQLTDGPGYDYQPDWSPDGRHIVYTSYRNDALELWLLDTRDGSTRALVANGAVNLDPRWSADGNRIAYVSTEYQKRWHIFVCVLAPLRPGKNHRRFVELTAPLLLQPVRSFPFSHLVARREGADPGVQPGPRMGLRRDLAHAGAPRRRSRSRDPE